MAKSKSRLNKISVPVELLFNLIVGAFALACIIPFIFVIIISFSSKDSISHIGYSFIPETWSTEAYEYAFKMGDVLWRSYANSFIVTIIGTLLGVLVCVMYSYALFREDFKGRGFFNFFSFFTMLFGGGLVPTYIVCKNVLGLSENYAALIVPMLVNPFNIIIMKTFFKSSVPNEIIEAAKIDGAGEYRTLFQIVTPVAKPGIATVALLYSLAYWNDWYLALLYIKVNKELIPLQTLLMTMQRSVEYMAKNSHMLGPEASKVIATLPSQSLRMAVAVMIIVPIACAYPFFQRYVVQGLTVGSVKG